MDTLAIRAISSRNDCNSLTVEDPVEKVIMDNSFVYDVHVSTIVNLLTVSQPPAEEDGSLPSDAYSECTSLLFETL